jgi:hypothetical protein
MNHYRNVSNRSPAFNLVCEAKYNFSDGDDSSQREFYRTPAAYAYNQWLYNQSAYDAALIRRAPATRHGFNYTEADIAAGEARYPYKSICDPTYVAKCEPQLKATVWFGLSKDDITSCNNTNNTLRVQCIKTLLAAHPYSSDGKRK